MKIKNVILKQAQSIEESFRKASPDRPVRSEYKLATPEVRQLLSLDKQNVDTVMKSNQIDPRKYL